MRLTVAQFRASDIPNVLDLAPDDPRIPGVINSATQVLLGLGEGKWWGTYQRIRICVSTSNCLTWPRRIARIDSVAMCGQPIRVNNEWYEFLENGPGIIPSQSSCGVCSTSGGTCGPFQFYNRGTACCFEDISGTKKIRVYATQLADVGKKIVLQGYDSNGQWIRSRLIDGSWIDGVQVVFSMPFVDTSASFTSLTGVQKDPTISNVLLYAVDAVTGQNPVAMASYEPDEVNPVYQRSYIPSYCNANCTTRTITAMASLEFIPVVNDSDWLLISNLPALELACQAIKKKRENLFEESNAYLYGTPDRRNVMRGGALQMLNDELNRYTNKNEPAIGVMNFEAKSMRRANVGMI